MPLKINILMSVFYMVMFFAANGHAAKIILKDGRHIEGNIIEQTAEHIRLGISGIEVTFYADEIASGPADAPGESTPSPRQSSCSSWSYEARSTEEAVNLFQQEEYKKAETLLQPLAKQGNLRAAVYLWDIHKNGKGVFKNPTKAAQWLQQAMEEDVHRAFFWMWMKEGQHDKQALERKIEEACDLRQKAEQGDASAQSAVLNLLAKYERLSPKISPAVLNWYRKAAAQDDPRMQYRLGDYLASGPADAGNHPEAIDWLWKAHDGGVKDAVKSLLKVYRAEAISNAPPVKPLLRGNLEFAERLWNSPLDKARQDMFTVYAVEGKDAVILRYLLEKGADPNAKKPETGLTALMIALGQNDMETLRLLLEHRADPNVLDRDGNYPLMAAINSGNVALLELLLDHGANPNGIYPEDQRVILVKVPLMVAANNSRRDIMELLLKKGADVNYQTGDGHTLLMWFATAGSFEFVEFLIRHGADPKIRNNGGLSAADYAMQTAAPDSRILQLLQ